MKIIVVVLALALASSGCDIVGACDKVLVPGVHLTVRDSSTSAPLASGVNATVIYSGATADTLTWLAADPILFIERSGVYDLEVLVPGFMPWIVMNVRVRLDDDDCHLRTVDLVARLQPLRPHAR